MKPEIIVIFIVLFLGIIYIVINKKSTDKKILKNKKIEQSNFSFLQKSIETLRNEVKQQFDTLSKNILKNTNIEQSNFLLLKDNIEVLETELEQKLDILENQIIITDEKHSSNLKELDSNINILEKRSKENLSNFSDENNKKLVVFNEKIEDVYNEFDKMKFDSNNQLKQLVEIILNKISLIKQENDILRKNLEYFSEIKEDSNTLNEIVDLDKENELIRNILKSNEPTKTKENIIKEKLEESQVITEKQEDNEERNKIEKTNVDNEKTVVNGNEYTVIEYTDNEPIKTKENIIKEKLNEPQEIIEKQEDNEERNKIEKTNVDNEKTDVRIETIVFNGNEYEVIEYTDNQSLHDIIKESLSKNKEVFIEINKSYKAKEFEGTIQKIKSITNLYPDNKTFYIRFDSNNIGLKSIDRFLYRNNIVSNHQEVENNSYSGLDVQQQRAYRIMEDTHDNIFISGKAGTGKSFLLKLFSMGSKKKHLVVAPTGISALNINGVTIHSAFGYNNLELGSNLENIRLHTMKKEVLRKIDVLVIDEISMVRADILDKIDLILQRIRNNLKLFGGVQIVVFGDLFQLPPIANRNENKYLQDKYGGLFFFHSQAYQNGDFKYIELFENHRQNGDLIFFNILNNIREGNINEVDINNLNNRFNPITDLRRILKLFPKKEQVERINTDELLKIKAKEYSFVAEYEFVKNINLTKNIENIFPINFTLNLKLGALIMMVKNDIDKRWVNGTLGIISYISQTQLKVTIDGTEYEIEKEYFESKEAKYLNGKIHYETVLKVKQFPMILAYAITIHKSQGMTYKNVACDLTETFTSGQSYVALSRCSTLKGLHLIKKITGEEIRINHEVLAFYRRVYSQKN